MAKSGSDGQTRYLSTSRAAKRLNLSEGTVRDLCKRGLLPGAYQKDKRGVGTVSLPSLDLLSAGRNRDFYYDQRPDCRFELNPGYVYCRTKYHLDALVGCSLEIDISLELGNFA